MKWTQSNGIPRDSFWLRVPTIWPSKYGPWNRTRVYMIYRQVSNRNRKISIKITPFPLSTGSLKRNLYNQVVTDGPRHPKPQHEFNFGECILRFDRATLGCGTRRLHSHLNETHRTRLFGGIFARWQISSFRQLWQVCAHLEHTNGNFGAQLQGHRRYFWGLLEFAWQQSGCECLGR